MSGAMRVAPPAGFTPVVPRPAATLIMLREGQTAPIEAFLQMRHERMDFVPGVLVFPGGGMDKADSAAELQARTRGAGHLGELQAGLVVAAIRETFEECGVLFARQAGCDALIDADYAAALAEKRAAINSKALTFGDLVKTEDLELAGDLIRPFSRWITPWFRAKRYDTHFFTARAPAGQVPLHDGGEAVESIWYPLIAEQIAEDAARMRLMPPTMRSLQRVMRTGSLEAALAGDDVLAAHCIDPWLERREGGFVLVHQLGPGETPLELPIGEIALLKQSPELTRAIEAELAARGRWG